MQRSSVSKPTMTKWILALLIVVIGGCVTRDLEQSQILQTTRVCVLSLCETSERVDRVGDPQATDSTVNEAVDEANTNQQDEDADVKLPPI